MCTRRPLSRPSLLGLSIKFMLVASLLATFSSASSALAVHPDRAYEFKAATWNMQGSSSGSQNKWAQVQAMMRGAADSNFNTKLDILALQESGSEPSTARPFTGIVPTISEIPINELEGLRAVSGASVPYVNVYNWNLGTTNRPENVFIYQFSMGTRLNVAIVSRYSANEIFVLPPDPPQSSTRRPVLGIRIGQSAFFSIHAAAIGGGNEAPKHVTSIENAMKTYDLVSSWMILGDFNRSPNSLSSALTPSHNYFTRRIIYDQTQTATQQSGNILDYAVVGADQYISPSRVLMRARVMSVRSDHSAVAVSPSN